MSLDCNRAYCEFNFFGEANALRLFLNSIRGDRTLEEETVPPIDFNKIIPPPDSSDQWYEEANEKVRDEWNKEHWGCDCNGFNWFVDENFKREPARGSAMYSFQCDSTPRKIVEELIGRCNAQDIKMNGCVFYAVKAGGDKYSSIYQEWFEEEDSSESFSFPGTIEFDNDGIKESDDADPQMMCEVFEDRDYDIEDHTFSLENDEESDGEEDE